ncbi:unnamed protein product [Pleuronectes platessa]|uniref:Uncharacterized protein n=1 Tax=Pleuronectes platessa TaxID=8262 RepID=A0A9N7TQU2_PLEPL|nr:unnamed protein product [Pleuronectes platessa]
MAKPSPRKLATIDDEEVENVRRALMIATYACLDEAITQQELYVLINRASRQWVAWYGSVREGIWVRTRTPLGTLVTYCNSRFSMKQHGTSNIRLCPECKTGYIMSDDLHRRCESCLGPEHAGLALTPGANCTFCKLLTEPERRRRADAYTNMDGFPCAARTAVTGEMSLLCVAGTSAEDSVDLIDPNTRSGVERFVHLPGSEEETVTSFPFA